MLIAKAKSYHTYYLLPLTFYLLLQKNPAIQGKSEEVRGKKAKT